MRLLPESYDSYHTASGARYRQPDRRGMVTMPVLTFLRGEALTELVWDWLEGVRPSMVCVRGFADDVAVDSAPWRVTIYLDQDDRILDIVQEIEVGLVGVRNGRELERKTFREEDSA